MYADEILFNIEQSEKVWPHNAHLLNHFRIEDYVRLALRYRDDAMVDGQALVPPMGVSADLHHDFVSYPFEDPASMLASMHLCAARARECGAAAFVCATCSRSIPGPRKPSSFQIIWVSAPPSVVGVALCSTCAPRIIDTYKPARI